MKHARPRASTPSSRTGTCAHAARILQLLLVTQRERRGVGTSGRHGDCALSMTDSTTSEGWLRKTNFHEDSEDPAQSSTRIQVARDHAKRYLDLVIKDYSQWFPGEENVVADSLSCDDDRMDKELTNILCLFAPLFLHPLGLRCCFLALSIFGCATLLST